MGAPIGSQPKPDPSIFLVGDAESRELQGLGALAYVDAVDGLSVAEKTELQNSALKLLDPMNPQLPAGDVAKLKAWLQTLQNYSTGSKTGTTINNEVFNKETPATNPYMNPGIMAILYPMLSEMQRIMAKIVLQSSKLDQAMINLTLTMAKDIFEYTVAAGHLRADQLKAEATSQFLQGAISLATAVGTIACMANCKSKQEKDIKELESNFNSPAKVDTANPKYTQKLQELDTKFPDKNTAAYAQGKADLNNDFTTPAKVLDPKDPNYLQQKSAIVQKWTNQESMINSIVSQFLSTGSSMAQGAISLQKAKLTEEEAYMNGLSQMLEKLMSTISQTQQKAIDEGKGASDFLQKMISMVKEMSDTVTRSLHQG